MLRKPKSEIMLDLLNEGHELKTEYAREDSTGCSLYWVVDVTENKKLFLTEIKSIYTEYNGNTNKFLKEYYNRFLSSSNSYTVIDDKCFEYKNAKLNKIKPFYILVERKENEKPKITYFNAYYIFKRIIDDQIIVDWEINPWEDTIRLKYNNEIYSYNISRLARFLDENTTSSIYNEKTIEELNKILKYLGSVNNKPKYEFLKFDVYKNEEELWK